MSQEQLKKHIRKKLRSGYPAGELENELLEKGISKEAIQDAMNNPKYQWDASSTRSNMIAINGACLLFVALSFIVSGINLYITGGVGLIAALIMYILLFRQMTK